MEFKKYKLGEITEITAGGDAPNNYTKEPNSVNSIPIFSNGIENEGLYGYTNFSKIDRNSFTISARGTIGVSFKRNKPYYPIVRLLSVVPKNDYFDVDYLYYASKLFKFKKDGSVQQQLTIPMLSEIELMIPSLKNQQKISTLLNFIDDKITLNRRINTKLEALAKRLYDYWFVQFDFPNADGKPYKSSGGKMEYNGVLKREIPAGWEVTPLKKCIKHINTGLNPRDNFVLGNGNIKYVTVKNLTESGMIDFSNCDLIDEEARAMVHNRSDIKIGDILFASICPLGRCYLINEEPKDWDINESVFTIRPNYKNMSSQLLYSILRDEYYVKKMTQKATGSIFKGIRVDDLEKIEIVLPSKGIVDSFTTKIIPILNQQAKLQQESMKLSEMRDKLLPLLMNGQVEVK